jgi:putative ABC transport system permease protein
MMRPREAVAMLRQDVVVGWRTLVRDPVYSLVVVLGLAIGFAACLLLLGFVRYSWQYNAHVPEVDQVYVVKQRDNRQPSAPWFDQVPLLLRAAALAAPGVDTAAVWLPTRPQRLTARIDGQLRRHDSLTVTPEFARTLGLVAVQGNLDAALRQPDSFAITEGAARAAFGSADVIGRTMTVDGKSVRVGAVLRTPPANTTIPFETVFGTGSAIVPPEIREELATGAHGWWGKMLIRMHPGAPLEPVRAALQDAVDRAPVLQNVPAVTRARLNGRKVLDVALAPLGEAYFDQDLGANPLSRPGPRGNRTVVAGLAAIALLILLLAAINYVNLATARVVRRQREIAMRKVLGADPHRIAMQFVAEALLVALLATGLGLLLAWLALPLFAGLMARELDGMLSLANLGMGLTLGVLLGLASAINPVWNALRVAPHGALGGRQNSESAGARRLRRLMTVLQIGTAMGLACVALAITWQTRYALASSPGFDPSHLLIVDLESGVKGNAAAQGLIAALKADGAVAGVTISEDAVGRHDTAWSRELRRPGAADARVEMKSVSANFFEQYGIRPLAGRLFDPRIDAEEAVEPLVVDPETVRQLGFTSPAQAVGQLVDFTNFDDTVAHKRIVGVAPALRFQSLHEAPRPVAYEIWTAGSTLTVKAARSMAEAETAVRTLWPRWFPDAVLTLHRADDVLAADYADDARVARLVAIATGIALAIAAFGTYALAADAAQKRALEIVLRKLHGARRRDIGMLMLRETGALLLAGAAIGLPLGALVSERYLATFVERAPFGYWNVALAFVASACVAMLAMAQHTWGTMRMRPADALRG